MICFKAGRLPAAQTALLTPLPASNSMGYTMRPTVLDVIPFSFDRERFHELDNGAFPTTEEGLNALFTQPASAPNWNGPYLERKPKDPWGREYEYKSPGQHRSDYDLYSLGRDGRQSEDDITNWEK